MPKECAHCAEAFVGEIFNCAGCRTMYCDAGCARNDLTHRLECARIAEVGCEQFHADARATEAATEAAAECGPAPGRAESCVVCAEGGEGLVRGCACSDEAGYAHLACLTRRAAGEDGEENGLSGRWVVCSRCAAPCVAPGSPFWFFSQRRTVGHPPPGVVGTRARCGWR